MWSDLYSLIYNKFREYGNRNMLNNTRRNSQIQNLRNSTGQMTQRVQQVNEKKTENCYKFKREREKKERSNKQMQLVGLVKILIPMQHKKIFLRQQSKDWMLNIIEK